MTAVRSPSFSPGAGLPEGPRRSGPSSLALILIYLGGHATLGLLALSSSMLATAHGVVVAGLLVVTAFGSSRLDRLVLVTVYAALCDVFWRMTGASLPWELSKYLLLLGAGALAVRIPGTLRARAVPIAFVAVTVISIAVVTVSWGPGAGRVAFGSEIGLFAMAVAVLAFRQLVVSEAEAWQAGWMMLGPIVAVLAVITRNAFDAGDLGFTSNSNFEVTGGFGPNQVSSMLGLGVLVCVLLAMQRRGVRFIGPLLALGLWLVWAAFLTFSRGGVYSLVLAGVAMSVVGVGTSGVRARSIVTAVMLTIGIFVAFSSANDFSGSWLDTRYEEGGSTGREALAMQDLRMWAAHPILGVGSGRSPQLHVLGSYESVNAHTEFTRLLAENGLLGLGTMVLLICVVVHAFRNSTSQWNRLLVAAGSVWVLTTMLHSATRIGAVSLVVALTQIRVERDG